MANTLQSKKLVRRNDKRQDINIARISRIKSFIKGVETAVEAGDHKGAQEALKNAQPEIARGVTKGVFHKKTASRKISRLATRVNSLG